MRKSLETYFTFAFLLGCMAVPGGLLEAQTTPPITGTWAYHPTPEAAGWDPGLLSEAKSYFDSINSAAVMVVYDGKVLLAWGNYGGEYLTHSARKSFMSAMVGIYADSGVVDLDRTLAELGIDDDPPLTDLEKRARVRDLLAARSGVYHTAAAETQQMHEYKPQRGTYGPDEFWAYNNWDFNALVTIFNQETGRDFFECLVEGLGRTLGMEDFGLDDTQYWRLPDRSIHPAYHFKISARDAARFGLLYLNGGTWEGRQIVPRAWIVESTRAISNSSPYIRGTRYGYMWWVFPKGYGSDQGLEHVGQHEMYAALGAYGQVIMVIPEADVVFVHRVDSYNGMNVPLDEWMTLLDRILAAGP